MSYEKRCGEWESAAIAAAWQGGPRERRRSFLRGCEPVVGKALKRITAEAAEAWAGSGAYERVALSYLGISAAADCLLCEEPAAPSSVLACKPEPALVLMLLCWWEREPRRRRRGSACRFGTQWWHFWRHWYPHLFFLFCFEELAHLMTLFSPEWQDAKLLAFDHWVDGRPTDHLAGTVRHAAAERRHASSFI